MKAKVNYVLFLLFFTATVSAQTITDSLVVFYPFNGNANDATTNSLDATVHGATLSSDRFGDPNGAYLFDGVDDYIELPNDSRLKPQFPFSVSMWVTFNGINPVNTVVIYKNDDASSGYHGFWIGINPSGQIACAYGDGNGFGTGNRRTKHSDTLINFNDWFHIVAVFNGQNDIDLYVNCSEDQGSMSGGATNSSIPYTSVNPKIGWSQNATPIYFQGKMDEIAFWNRSLTYMEARRLCDNMPISTNNRDIKTEPEIFISPNPVKDLFTINNLNNDTNIVRIFDITGKLVLSRNVTNNSNSINITDLNNGIYIVSVSDGEDRIVRKIIKQ